MEETKVRASRLLESELTLEEAAELFETKIATAADLMDMDHCDYVDSGASHTDHFDHVDSSHDDAGCHQKPPPP